MTESASESSTVILSKNAYKMRKTERSLDERSLSRRNDALLQFLVESSDDAIICKSLEGKIVTWNAGAQRIYGYTAEEVIGKPIFILVPPEIPNEIPEILEKIKRGDHVDHYQTVRIRKDRGRINVSICASPIKDERDNIIGASVIARDITENMKHVRALGESKKKYRRLIENIRDIVFAVGVNGKVTFVSPSAERVTGSKLNEIVGKPFLDFFPSIKVGHAQSTFAKMLKGECVKGEQAMIPRRDGTPVYYEVDMYPVFLNGEVVGIQGVARDVSERIEVEEVLHASLDRYRSFIEATGELGWTTNADGEVVEDIPSFRKFTGQTYQEVKGRGWLKALHPDDIERTAQIWKEAIRTKSKYEIEYRLRRYDGAYSYFMARGVPVLKEDGSVREWVGSCIDITERKNAEEATMESQQKFKQIFMGNPEAAVYIDRNATVLDVNQRFSDLFGYSLADSKGKPLDDLIVPEDRRKEATILSRKSTKGYLHHESDRMNRDGLLIPVAISAAPIVLHGKYLGSVVLYEDITERRKAEEKIHETIRKLEVTNEKLQVVGGLTRHDVRNKLAAIMGNAYLVKKTLPENNAIQDYVKQIEQSVEHSAGIFDFAKAYEMLGVEELAYVDVEKTVNDAVSLLPNLKDIKVTNDCHGLTVLADSLLRQLFYNLIDNSIKHGEKLNMIRIHYEDKNDHLNMIYQDDGAGISPAVKSKLFSQGYTTGEGSGYGLYLIKKMVEVYGWTIKENGELGKGALFTITVSKTDGKGRINYKLH
jgi:PAS domain S-box-containing protein